MCECVCVGSWVCKLCMCEHAYMCVHFRLLDLRQIFCPSVSSGSCFSNNILYKEKQY